MLSPFRPVLAALLLTGLAASARAADAPPVPLMKGDRIVFLGDSITEQGAGPKGFVTLIRHALQEKHKDLGIEVIGAGVSGNKVPDIQGRLEHDVLAKKPTLVVIYIGINDVWHGEKDPAKGTSKEKYEAGLRDVIKRCQDAGARVVLCTPSVIGEKNDGSDTNDPKLDEYADISRAVAKDLKSSGLRSAKGLSGLREGPQSRQQGERRADQGSRPPQRDGRQVRGGADPEDVRRLNTSSERQRGVRRNPSLALGAGRMKV